MAALQSKYADEIANSFTRDPACELKYIDLPYWIDDKPDYQDKDVWRLIEAFSKRSGVPVVINTSFNIKGEPIVCTPDDALKCYYGTDIDFLVIGDFIVRKAF